MNNAFVVVVLSLALSGVAFAQQKSAKEQIVGAWTLVSVTSEMDDGKKGEPFVPPFAAIAGIAQAFHRVLQALGESDVQAHLIRAIEH